MKEKLIFAPKYFLLINVIYISLSSSSNSCWKGSSNDDYFPAKRLISSIDIYPYKPIQIAYDAKTQKLISIKTFTAKEIFVYR